MSLTNLDAYGKHQKQNQSLCHERESSKLKIYFGQGERKVRRMGYKAMLEQDAVHFGCEVNLAAHILEVKGNQLLIKTCWTVA